MKSVDNITAEKLSKMIQCETINKNDDFESLEKIKNAHDRYEELFPLVHKNTTKIDFDGTILYKWTGSTNNRKSILLMSHTDVVGAKGEWKYPPFSGTIADGRVWGRGAIDTKGYLCSIFQAMELLIESGFTPSQDIYLLSTHNEETSGDGAPRVLKYFKENNINFSIVLDEGGLIVEDVLPGLEKKCAMVGVMEKGYSDIKFTAKANGGHSSMPSKNTPIARLSAFVNEVENSKVFEVKITEPLKEMLESLSSYMSWQYKFLFSNLWLTGPLLKYVFLKMGGETAAMLRTTCVFTMAKGSDAANVIPAEAYVVANLRFMIHEGKDKSLSKLKKISNKYDLEMEVLSSHDCSTATSSKSSEYKYIEATLKNVFPEIAIAPFIMLGATDSRYYHEIADAVIKFTPMILDTQQLKSIHGIDENISISSLNRCTEFIVKFIQGLN